MGTCSFSMWPVKVYSILTRNKSIQASRILTLPLWQTAPKDPDERPPQSVLGDLAWMPPTAGVLRFAQYLKNRNPTLSSGTNTAPPASQRKRVAAVQDKKNASVRLPSSPPRPNTKGTMLLIFSTSFLAPKLNILFFWELSSLFHSPPFYSLLPGCGLCKHMHRCCTSSLHTCWEGWSVCRDKGISGTWGTCIMFFNLFLNRQSSLCFWVLFCLFSVYLRLIPYLALYLIHAQTWKYMHILVG